MTVIQYLTVGVICHRYATVQYQKHYSNFSILDKMVMLEFRCCGKIFGSCYFLYCIVVINSYYLSVVETSSFVCTVCLFVQTCTILTTNSCSHCYSLILAAISLSEKVLVFETFHCFHPGKRFYVVKFLSQFPFLAVNSCLITLYHILSSSLFCFCIHLKA